MICPPNRELSPAARYNAVNGMGAPMEDNGSACIPKCRKVDLEGVFRESKTVRPIQRTETGTRGTDSVFRRLVNRKVPSSSIAGDAVRRHTGRAELSQWRHQFCSRLQGEHSWARVFEITMGLRFLGKFIIAVRKSIILISDRYQLIAFSKSCSLKLVHAT